MEDNYLATERNQEHLSNAPGFHVIDIDKQYQDLFLLDKKIADQSNGLLLPLESPAELKKYLQVDHRTNSFLLNNEEGEHVGYFSYYDKDEKTSELLSIGVLKDFQGKGYANRMMQKYFQLCNDKDLLVLVTRPDNSQAIRFYQKLGYIISELKKDYYGPREDRVYLELKR